MDWAISQAISDLPVSVELPAEGKDYNEWLVATKLNLADQKKEQMTIAGQCH